MSSGIEVEEECVLKFNEMKLGEHKGQNRCIIYKIGDDRKYIVVERVIPKNTSKNQEDEYNDIISTLPTDQGRYIVWDLTVPNAKNGQLTDRLLFMSCLHLAQHGLQNEGHSETPDFPMSALSSYLCHGKSVMCPDTAAVGAKMIFASSKDALKKKLTGIQSAIDCSDSSDLDYKEVAAKAMKGH